MSDLKRTSSTVYNNKSSTRRNLNAKKYRNPKNSQKIEIYDNKFPIKGTRFCSYGNFNITSPVTNGHLLYPLVTGF